MNAHTEMLHKHALDRVVSSCRAILSCQVGLHFGCLRLSSRIGAEVSDELKLITYFDSYEQYVREIRDFPNGTARLRCEINYLLKMDAQLQEINSKYREKVFRFCRSVIDLYGENDQPTNDWRKVYYLRGAPEP